MTNPLQLGTMNSSRARLLRATAALALVAVTGLASVVATSPNISAQAETLGAGGEYHPIEPARILDTRIGINDPAPRGAKAMTTGGGASFDVQVLGQGGLPAIEQSGEVLAVAVNVTVVAASDQGYARVWGTGASEGGSSLVNFQRGENVPNMAIVRPGTDGKLSVRLVSEGVSGNAHVLIDVFGWFSTSVYGDAEDTGARLIPAGPGRIFDSRRTEPLGPGESVAIDFRGADGLNPPVADVVPVDENVVGALVNVTGMADLQGSSDTFVSVLPDAPVAGVLPATSNLNLRRGQVKANLVMVPIGADGRLHLYNERGQTHLAVDVVAFLQSGHADTTRQGRVVPLVSPYRALDTRPVQLAPDKAEDWSFADFVADVRIGSQTVGAQSAVIGNLTGTGLSRQFDSVGVDTYLTAFPKPASGSGLPEVSNLNLTEGRSVPNMALLRYGPDSEVRFYNYNGFVDYVFDASAVVLADES